MENNLNDLDYVEQELGQLRSRLQQTFAILDALAKIPSQFEELGQNYQQLKQDLDEVKANRAAFNQRAETEITGRLAKLETDMESQWTEFKARIVHLQDELGAADIHLSNYNAELAKQVSEIREEVTKRLDNFWQEWARNEIAQTSLTKIINNRLNTGIEAFIQQLSEAGFNPQNFEKQETLETELRLTQSSLQETNRQLHMIRNFTTVTGITVAITLALVIFQLLNRT